MANKEVKFTKEEMEQIEELQQTYVGLQNALGQMGVARIRLEQQINNLNEENQSELCEQFLTDHETAMNILHKYCNLINSFTVISLYNLPNILSLFSTTSVFGEAEVNIR